MRILPPLILLLTGGILAGTTAVSANAPDGIQSLVLRQSTFATQVCSFRYEWRGPCTATPDAREMYISFSHEVYRLDLAAAIPLQRSRWVILMGRPSCSSIRCHPADFILTVWNPKGMRERAIIKKVTRLTPTEVTSLPKSLRP